MDNILISFIMPTLNSEKTIEKSLFSIRMQNFDQEKIEILVIDGGSTDRTLKIAQKYKAAIIHNPKIVPEAAKHIGITKAKGKYAVLMDSDEEFTHKEQITKRIEFFNRMPEVKNLLPASIALPKDYSSLSQYINSFGDPFSYFVYRIDSENFPKSLMKRCKYQSVDIGNLYEFKKGDVLAIADGGTCMFDLNYLKNHFTEEMMTPEIVTTYFVRMVSKTNCMGIVHNDKINHYSSTKFKIYLKKLKFRVINNLNNTNESYAGFASKASMNNKLNSKKYLFPIYCLLFPWVFWDALYMTINKKNITLISHVVFVYYVFFQIIYLFLLKLFGVKIKNKSYGA